ncbi:MAG TPA: hypothetical protein DEP19_00590 [Anaerolineae bacterium]|nr:hypothetical protein [Anaerolineae bacterium]HCK65543.1 hypothetical protein [Anaerolineae bacterium]
MKKRIQYIAFFLMISLFLASCATQTISQTSRVDFPQVQSVSLASTPNGKIYIALGAHHTISIASSTDGGKTFSEPILASSNVNAHVLPVERPVLAVHNENIVATAWLEQSADFTSATIWYTSSNDGGQTFSEPIQVATDSGFEIVMVQVVFNQDGNPLLTWLTDGTLRYTYSDTFGESFAQVQTIEGGACECCQPSLIAMGEQVWMAYRGLELHTDGNNIRDILVAISNDGGKTYQSTTRVSDAHWYLNACPIAGPSFASFEDTLYITWMDGREAEANTKFTGSVWFSSSTDLGKSFSPNVKINPNPEIHQTMPFMAIDTNGDIHLVWETHSSDAQNIQYAYSNDNGNTFSKAQALVNSDNGTPRMPVLVTTPNNEFVLAWIDTSGAHVLSWME